MADEQQQSRPPWKRAQPLASLTPPWLGAQVDRLEHAREETLDSARKRQKETPREEAEESQAASSSAAASSAAATGEPTASGPEGLPPRVAEDMKNFKYVSLTPAAFLPTRHLFMCAGRPMVAPCFVYSPTPPKFVMPSPSHAPKESPQHNPMLWDCTGALSMQLLFGPRHHSEPLPISLNLFFSEPIVQVFIYTHGVYALCCQVLVMSHELADEKEMCSYFGNKFYPARPVYVVGRSYKAEPKCKPQETLFDNWMDRSHSHAMSPHCCIIHHCCMVVPHVSS